MNILFTKHSSAHASSETVATRCPRRSGAQRQPPYIPPASSLDFQPYPSHSVDAQALPSPLADVAELRATAAARNPGDGAHAAADFPAESCLVGLAGQPLHSLPYGARMQVHGRLLAEQERMMLEQEQALRSNRRLAAVMGIPLQNGGIARGNSRQASIVEAMHGSAMAAADVAPVTVGYAKHGDSLPTFAPHADSNGGNLRSDGEHAYLNPTACKLDVAAYYRSGIEHARADSFPILHANRSSDGPSPRLRSLDDDSCDVDATAIYPPQPKRAWFEDSDDDGSFMDCQLKQNSTALASPRSDYGNFLKVPKDQDLSTPAFFGGKNTPHQLLDQRTFIKIERTAESPKTGHFHTDQGITAKKWVADEEEKEEEAKTPCAAFGSQNKKLASLTPDVARPTDAMSVCAAPQSVLQHADATFWAHNTLGDSFDGHSSNEMTRTLAAAANPEDVDMTREQPCDTAKAAETTHDGGRMVTRGRKRSDKPDFRQIAGLRRKEQLTTVCQRSKAIKKQRVAAPAKANSKPASSTTGTKQFQFFYSRTCFRGMNEWYKHLHTESKDRKKGQKSVLQHQKWVDMRKSIEVVMAEELGLADVLAKGASDEREVTLLVVTLMMMLYTHRHLKDDVFITEARAVVNGLQNDALPLKGLGPLLNGSEDEATALLTETSVMGMKWSVQRDVNYRYSKKAEDRFMSYFFETYLFAVFGLSAEGRAFIMQKEDMTDEKGPKIEAEIDALTVKAIAALHKMAAEGAAGLSSDMTRKLLDHIAKLQAVE